MSGPSSHFPDTFLNDSYNIPYNNVPHSCPDFNTLSHTHTSEPLSSHSTSTFSAIASASHETLIRSGNAAYASINALHLQAKCELQAQRTLVSQLQDVINKLTSHQHPTVQSMPDTTPNQEKSDSLDVTDPPQPLDQEDYPYVSHWHEKDWVQYTERQHDCGKVPSRLGFLTNEEGTPVPEPWIKTFMSAAKQAWNELYRIWLDPKSWTKKTPKATSYLTYIMKTHFDEFWYCDGDWKVEWFAIIKYPDWCHNAREPGHLTCARPSKCKFDDGNDEHKRKKAKSKSTMLPGAQVIDLDAPTSPPATTAPNRSPTPTTASSPPPHASSIPTDVPDPTIAIPSPGPRPPLAPDLAPEKSTPSPSCHALHPSAVAPPARVCAASPTPAPSPPVPSTLPPCVPDPAPATATVNALPPPSTVHILIQDPSSPSLSEDNAGVPCSQTDATVDVATSSVNSGQQGQLRRVPVNLLAGLSIPKPSIQVPEDEPWNTPSGEAESASMRRKSDKFMVASSTALSAHNLFAIEYLQEHPMTTKPQFKKVWDNIASETKKKYEALSKEQKSAACLPAATTTNEPSVG